MNTSIAEKENTPHTPQPGMDSAPPHCAPWLFDPQDHQLVRLVNDFSAARARNQSLPQPDPALHPNGVIELTSEPGLRMARAVIILLESLEDGGPQERLHALRRLHDEVLYFMRSLFQKNTARVTHPAI